MKGPPARISKVIPVLASGPEYVPLVASTVPSGPMAWYV